MKTKCPIDIIQTALEREFFTSFHYMPNICIMISIKVLSVMIGFQICKKKK